jgi:hypothetical protein
MVVIVMIVGRGNVEQLRAGNRHRLRSLNSLACIIEAFELKIAHISVLATHASVEHPSTAAAVV